MNHFKILPNLVTFALLLTVLFPQTSQAARWVEIGNADNSLDKSYIDADSIKEVDGFRIISVMTVYQAPRENKNGITMDRHIQKTALDCSKKQGVGIQTVGYLGDKKVGSGPENADWKTNLKPLADNATSQRVLTAVCGAQAAGATDPSTQGKPKLSSGSGIIINSAGYILTNVHVINACKALVVKPMDGEAIAAKVEAVDPKNDLAIIKTNSTYTHAAHFRAESDPAKLGEAIGVIGYPLTGILSTEPKATFGEVSSVAGINNDYTLLQISAPVQPGNSGGPVFDMSGNVIGVIVSEVSSALAAKIGAVPQNVNFAIRGEIAQIFMNAHGIKFTAQESHKKMTTESIAAAGQQEAVLILCAR